MIEGQQPDAGHLGGLINAKTLDAEVADLLTGVLSVAFHECLDVVGLAAVDAPAIEVQAAHAATMTTEGSVDAAVDWGTDDWGAWRAEADGEVQLDATMALHHARDLYTRRNEGVSIWVVRAADITASSPAEKDPFFAPAGDKVYRHPTFYEIPDSVPHI